MFVFYVFFITSSIDDCPRFWFFRYSHLIWLVYFATWSIFQTMQMIEKEYVNFPRAMRLWTIIKKIINEFFKNLSKNNKRFHFIFQFYKKIVLVSKKNILLFARLIESIKTTTFLSYYVVLLWFDLTISKQTLKDNNFSKHWESHNFGVHLSICWSFFFVMRMWILLHKATKSDSNK